MNYITESSARRSAPHDLLGKDKEIPEYDPDSKYLIRAEGTLKNDVPRGTIDEERKSRETLRNEEPIFEPCLRKEFTPILNQKMSEYMKINARNAVTWEKTHFILAIEDGGNSLQI